MELWRDKSQYEPLLPMLLVLLQNCGNASPPKKKKVVGFFSCLLAKRRKHQIQCKHEPRQFDFFFSVLIID